MNYINNFFSSVSNMSSSQEASLKLVGVVAGVALLGIATFKTLNYFFPDENRTITKKIDGIEKTLERKVENNKIIIRLQEIENSPYTIRSVSKIFENSVKGRIAAQKLENYFFSKASDWEALNRALNRS